MKKKAIIIGAGPAGLSCAYELTKKGIPVEVYEACGNIGGMARSIDLWGQRVDLGPHRFFTQDKRVNGFFHEVLKGDYTIVNRLTRIYYKKRFFNYPLKVFNVLRNLNVFTVAAILLDYGRQRLRPIRDPQTFEDWVTNRFGRKLFSIFFRNYSEKLWGIPCSRIDADWAAQRIKNFSLWEALRSALKNNKANKHNTLVDKFAYPIGGTGMIYEKAAACVKQNGGKIHLNAPVKRVLLNDYGNACGIELMSGEVVEAETVISSMPLTQLVNRMEKVPAAVKEACEQLYFRNTILVYLEVDSQDLFADNWIYIHSPDVKHGRITNFRNWCPSLTRGKRTTILCLEYWAFDTDHLWKQDDESLCRLAEQEVYRLELVPGAVRILRSCVIRVPKCYPVYETGYMKPLKVIENYLDTVGNLIPIGRYGSFKYNNQDHSILMGLLAADKITADSKNNLWGVNTDGQYQEEGELQEL